MGLLLSYLLLPILAVLALLVFLLIIWWGVVARRRRTRSLSDLTSAIVLVLGDLGRSPRMQYHTLSLAAKGVHVDLVGYAGARLPERLLDSDKVTVHALPAYESPVAGLPYVIYAALKVLVESLRLLRVLIWQTRPPGLILVQNPPAIPTLVWARVCASLRGARLLIDFHNFGYSMLECKLGKKHPLVSISRVYEQTFGRWADGAFCVTNRMGDFLNETWQVRATALHDRPASLFRPTEPAAMHELLERLRGESALEGLEDWWPPSGSLLTTVSEEGGVPEWAAGRPLVVVSSTSWTADEDFDMLLDVLPDLESALRATQPARRVLIFITGRGPLRPRFEARYATLRASLEHVRVKLLWLKYEDYPVLLGGADWGLSLHTSTSGLDLPMKVVDMFGCGLPVMACDFPALPELVREGENGLVFAHERSSLVACLSRACLLDHATYTALRQKAGEFRLLGWDEQWNDIAWGAIRRLVQAP